MKDVIVPLIGRGPPRLVRYKNKPAVGFALPNASPWGDAEEVAERLMIDLNSGFDAGYLCRRGDVGSYIGC
jgi:hypothetical protein